jgi:hypothetical protein
MVWRVVTESADVPGNGSWFVPEMPETERENIREATLEGLDGAARKGNHDGRPAVITDDMLHTVLRRRAAGETVEAIQPDLIIPSGTAGAPPRPTTNQPPLTPGTRSRSMNWPNSVLPSPSRLLRRCLTDLTLTNVST